MKNQKTIESVQLNFRVPKSWLPELKQLAREMSYRDQCNVSYAELIRRAIEDKYGLQRWDYTS